MTPEAIEQQLNKSEPIRLLGLLKKREEPLNAFMKEFFTRWNEEKDTIFTNNRNVQTEAGKRRSLGDIYLICKHYYPKTTLKEVSNVLFNMFREVPRFRSSYCYRNNKRMFYVGVNDYEPTGIFDKSHTDEYGNQWNFYDPTFRPKAVNRRQDEVAGNPFGDAWDEDDDD